MTHGRLRRSVLAGVFAATAACSPPSATIQRLDGEAQGTTYSLQWVGHADVASVASAAALELARIDALLSTYRTDSLLEQFNATRSTTPHELTAELVSLLRLAKRVHAASGGCFDPTVRPLVRAWGFDRDEPAVPSDAALERAAAAVGLDKIELVDDSRVRKLVPEVELDMSSIGQGYTAARLAELLEELGAQSYLAEIGGEIVARGTKPDGEPWRIGIEDPTGRGGPLALTVPRDRSFAVVTSGTYRHYLDVDGHRLAHVFDARTHQPVEHDLIAVTVIADSGAEAAAWGTALLCLGPDEAAAVAEREGVAALWWIATGAESALPQRSSTLADAWPELVR